MDVLDKLSKRLCQEMFLCDNEWGVGGGELDLRERSDIDNSQLAGISHNALFLEA